jgi:hypothetical protein
MHYTDPVLRAAFNAACSFTPEEETCPASSPDSRALWAAVGIGGALALISLYKLGAFLRQQGSEIASLRGRIETLEGGTTVQVRGLLLREERNVRELRSLSSRVATRHADLSRVAAQHEDDLTAQRRQLEQHNNRLDRMERQLIALDGPRALEIEEFLLGAHLLHKIYYFEFRKQMLCIHTACLAIASGQIAQDPTACEELALRAIGTLHFPGVNVGELAAGAVRFYWRLRDQENANRLISCFLSSQNLERAISWLAYNAARMRGATITPSPRLSLSESEVRKQAATDVARLVGAVQNNTSLFTALEQGAAFPCIQL